MQNEPAVAEADSEEDQQQQAVFRLVEKGKHRDQAQLQASRQTRPTDHPWDTELKKTQNAESCAQ